MSDETELKPCPFCGGEAETLRFADKGYWDVGCHACEISPCTEDMFYETRAVAVAAWNRRVE